jgi:hypothetical protein
MSSNPSTKEKEEKRFLVLLESTLSTFFSSAGDGTQGLAHTRKVLYC